jgi:transcriptional regulator with XRE-family HTH domain
MTSFQLRLDPKKRKAGRFVGQVRAELMKAIAAEHAAHGLTLAGLARLLGVNRSQVSRALNGRSNLTLRTIAEYAHFLNRDIQFALVEPVYVAGANHHGLNSHDDWQVSVPGANAWAAQPHSSEDTIVIKSANGGAVNAWAVG